MKDVILSPIHLDEMSILIKQAVREEMKRHQSPQIEKPVHIEAAAKFTGRSKANLYKLSNDGVIPSHKVGHRRVFYLSELNEFIKSQPA